MPCPYPSCEKRSAEVPRLVRHIINAHVKSYPYICQLGCDGVKYNDMTNIKAHYKRHHGEKVFVKNAALADCLRTLSENARTYHESILNKNQKLAAFINETPAPGRPPGRGVVIQ